MTEAQEKRLQKIRERQPHRAEWQYGKDIDFLLSLVDGQAATSSSLLRKLKDFLFESCNHSDRDRNYDWCPACVVSFVETIGIPSDCEAADAMRSACIEKVKEMLAAWKYTDAEVIAALESVAIQEQKS